MNDDLEINYEDMPFANAVFVQGGLFTPERRSVRHLLRLLRGWRPRRGLSLRGLILGWWRGRLFVVGERGPELFVPITSGWIVPNDQVPHG